MTRSCRLCGRELDPTAPSWSPSLDCGGDCAACVYEFDVLMGCPRDQLGPRPRGISLGHLTHLWLRRWRGPGSRIHSVRALYAYFRGAEYPLGRLRSLLMAVQMVRHGWPGASRETTG